jgi:flavin reductase (DIM6/NTAB) family NADH-FMN oxidoreductase RutF
MAEIPAMARALGRVPSGLFILTTGVESSLTSSLVSLVQQVGFEPPAISVALARGRRVETTLRDHGFFCLAVLAESSKSLLAHFARGFASGEPPFEGIETAISDVDVPYPKAAHAHLACKVIGEVAWSDHVLFCGEVVGGACNGDELPLVHVRKDGLNY